MQWAIEDRKGSGQGTHPAEDLFCGFCHWREGDYTDKQLESSPSVPARPSQPNNIPLPVAEGRKDKRMRMGVYIFISGIHLCKLFL